MPRIQETGGVSDGTVTRAKLAAAAVKTVRVTTGSITGLSTASVTVTWPVAFPDTNYTVTAVVEDSGNDLRTNNILTKQAASVLVRVQNTGAGAVTGTVHAVAVGD